MLRNHFSPALIPTYYPYFLKSCAICLLFRFQPAPLHLTTKDELMCCNKKKMSKTIRVLVGSQTVTILRVVIISCLRLNCVMCSHHFFRALLIKIKKMVHTNKTTNIWRQRMETHC